MNRKRKKKFEKLIQLHEELQEIGKDIPANIVSSSKDIPLVDMIETDKELLIKVYIPEFRKDEIEIGVDDLILEIHAQKRDAVNDENSRYLIKESRSIYARKISLPDGTLPRELRARYEQNIIEIFIPYKKTHLTKFKIS